MNILIEEAKVTAVKDEIELGEMTFVNSGNFYIIDHTGVSEAAKGLGIGKKLVATFVEYAREQNMKVLPLCPFAKAEFEKNSAYADVFFGK